MGELALKGLVALMGMLVILAVPVIHQQIDTYDPQKGCYEDDWSLRVVAAHTGIAVKEFSVETWTQWQKGITLPNGTTVRLHITEDNLTILVKGKESRRYPLQFSQRRHCQYYYPFGLFPDFVLVLDQPPLHYVRNR